MYYFMNSNLANWLRKSRKISEESSVEYDLHMLYSQKKMRKLYEKNVYILNQVSLI